MASKYNEITEELKAEFDDGHVLISDALLDPASATAQAVAYVPDTIRWALQHKGVHITEGDVSAGIKTVDCWHIETIKTPWKKYTIKVNEPNKFLGYAGWEPK
jgi:glycine/D-amino acid oxidase-like deaminating enzyme